MPMLVGKKPQVGAGVRANRQARHRQQIGKQGKQIGKQQLSCSRHLSLLHGLQQQLGWGGWRPSWP